MCSLILLLITLNTASFTPTCQTLDTFLTNLVVLGNEWEIARRRGMGSAFGDNHSMLSVIFQAAFAIKNI